MTVYIVTGDFDRGELYDTFVAGVFKSAESAWKYITDRNAEYDIEDARHRELWKKYNQHGVLSEDEQNELDHLESHSFYCHDYVNSYEVQE